MVMAPNIVLGALIGLLAVVMAAEDGGSEGGGMFENVVEGFVKDLFNQELTQAKEQNLTDCMTRLLCENICQRTVKGEIKGKPLLDSPKMLSSTEKDPLGYFFAGGDRGYEYGQRNECHQCSVRYGDCPANQYHHTRSISDKYEKDMMKSAADSSVDKDFMDI